MRTLIPIPIVVPLFAAGLCLVFHRRIAVQRLVALLAVAVGLGASIALVVGVERNGTTALGVGAWSPPVGIVWVADPLAAVMLMVSMATVLCVLVFAIGEGSADEVSPFFHPVYLVLTAGVANAYLTGDIFNLFVSFELLLSASYVLITLGGSRPQVRSGMTYVVINLVASTLFLTSIALLYAATGTVTMADLVGKVVDLPDGLRTALGLAFLVAFGIKAAIFPLFFWLPDSYPTAAVPVTAIFAGLLTKVGVYAILRTQTQVFGGDGAPATLVLVLAGLTMVVGVLGAIAQDDMKRILSFHIVSQIGYMILGVGLATVAGVAGAIFFVVHQIPVKASLFLVSGLVERMTGTAALVRLGGLVRRAPVVAVLFLLAAFSLAGIPPLSGFPAKLALVQAGFGSGAWVVTGISLGVSLFTLLSMTKIWGGVFWGTPDEPTPQLAAAPARLRAPRLMTGATAALVAVTVAIAVAAGALWDVCLSAAEGLVDPTAYVQAVLGR